MKFAINKHQLEYVIINEEDAPKIKKGTGYAFHFSNGRVLILPEEVTRTYVQKRILIPFTDTMYVNPKSCNFIKNNFENQSATKYKITVAFSTKEVYTTFPLEEKDNATKLFKDLISELP